MKENLEKFEDDTKEKLEDEKRKVRTITSSLLFVSVRDREIFFHEQTEQ